ncbi:MAG: sugar phosphate nucleotidyltransferase, partial [Ilumatobacteraceae bacterium]
GHAGDVLDPLTTRRDRVLVVVLAGGAGGRLSPLTDRRAKPSLPFGGSYRLIDIALSQVAHSGLQDVWVIEQYEPHALNDHLANGRPWDLDRTHGGLRLLPPFQRGDGDHAIASGNADALVQQRRLLAEFAPDVVITMSADHVFRLDLRDVLDTHAAAGATLTIVTTELPAGDDPSRFAWVSVEDGCVTAFEYKPDEPTGDRVCTEVFVFDGPELLTRLAVLADEESAGDYGDRLVPDVIADGGVIEHRLGGYWRDVGTINSYHRAHMELVGEHPPLPLDDPAWPLLTGSIVGGPARVGPGAEVVSSLLSPGVVVDGVVESSVLGRNVVVEAGAVVRTSVVLDDAVIRAGAVVETAIVDVGTSVGAHDEGRRDEGWEVVVHPSS